MGSYTTIQFYKRILDFWYISGISPLQFCPCNTDDKSIQSVVKSDKDDESLSSGDSFNQKFEFFEVYSWRNAKCLFWFTFTFATCSITFYFTRFFMLLHMDPLPEISNVIGSFCWCSYIWSCFFIYIMHVGKATAICELLMDWQSVEGEILTESKAVQVFRQRKAHKFWDDDHRVPSFIVKSQSLALKLFQITIPASIALMGFNIAFHPRYPMYFYSMVPSDIESDFLKVFCFFATWSEVIFFALCENQIELLYIAFACSVSNCLKLLTMPAKMWTDSGSLRSQPKPFMLLENTFTDIEILKTLEDSVDKYEKLNLLLRKFNRIFAWPMFGFKTITLVRLCCYVYVILKHPKGTGFPSTMVFPYAVVAILCKFGWFLSSLGAVYNNTNIFIKSWKTLILQVHQQTAWQERRLKSCIKFGFICGNFYTVQPSTILTFCSVTLTYLIIFLQLGPSDEKSVTVLAPSESNSSVYSAIA